MPVTGPHRTGRATTQQPSPYPLSLHGSTSSRVRSLMSDTASTVTTISQPARSEPGNPRPGFTERMTDGGHTRLVHKIKHRSNVPPLITNQLSENDKINLIDAGRRLIVKLCSVDCWPHHKTPRPGQRTGKISATKMTAEVIIAVNASARRENRDESPKPPATEVSFRHQVSQQKLS